MTTGQNDNSGTDKPATPDIRRIPAHVGVVAHAPVGAGQPAQAGQPGEVTADRSGLVGDGTDGLPAAEPKRVATPTTPTTPPSESAMPKVERQSSPPPAAPVSAAPVTVRRTGFWPVAFGGVVAAGLGAAATIYALPHLPAGWLPTAPAAEAPADPQAALDAARDAGRAAAEEVLANQPADAPGAGLPADLEQRLAALEAGGGTTDADALTALQQRLDQLESRPGLDPQAVQTLQQQIEASVADAQARLAEVQAQAESLQDAAVESTRRAEAVAAVATLQGALDAGVTPDQARETLEGAGLETPEALQAQVPSLTELQADFPEAARGALRATLRESSASGEGNLLTNFLRAQTGARSVEPRDGDDADAILSRADADMAAGRVEAALEQLSALPPAAAEAPAMADWLSRATAYSQARAALTDLSSGTN
ncbi:COG4223 family protein [Paracoccus sp. ME4]|uniref:COG4223 family protein n=1 Tax=Paracoccus sp. ME4 TaxID=3138066 RepID=UPI00398A86A8